MSILADIAEGETNWADLFFLFAVIFAGLAAVLYAVAVREPQATRWAPVTLSLAVGLAALGWLVL